MLIIFTYYLNLARNVIDKFVKNHCPEFNYDIVRTKLSNERDRIKKTTVARLKEMNLVSFLVMFSTEIIAAYQLSRK